MKLEYKRIDYNHESQKRNPTFLFCYQLLAVSNLLFLLKFLLVFFTFIVACFLTNHLCRPFYVSITFPTLHDLLNNFHIINSFNTLVPLRLIHGYMFSSPVINSFITASRRLYRLLLWLFRIPLFIMLSVCSCIFRTAPTLNPCCFISNFTCSTNIRYFPYFL